MNELNKKLAERARFRAITLEGWEGYYKAPVGVRVNWTYTKPRFTDSTDACFKWLVPTLGNKYAYSFWQADNGRWIIQIEKDREGEVAGAVADTPALAFCKAVEQLIDAEVTR